MTERKRLKQVLYSGLLVLVLAAAFSCSGAPEKTKVRVLCAGSLMVPFDTLEKAYEASHPNVDILIEGHGSIQVIRHVTELHEEADVLAVADDSLIPMMMYNTKVPETDTPFSDWHIKFSTNSLGIACLPAGKYADEINNDNWYEILSRPDIKLGFADARLDACGYYTLMLLSLAEFYYRHDSLFEDVLGPFNPPLQTGLEGSASVVTVPEILRPDNDKTVVRASSIRLLALLESGDIDYSFEYASVARQHNLKFISLPPEINLGDYRQNDFYSRVMCRLDFQRFASVPPEFHGEPIIYGITVPANSPHPMLAQEFIRFLLGPEGRQIMEATYQPVISPVADNPDNLPLSLRELINQ